MNGDLLKVGDNVVIDIPNENWQWGFRPLKNQKGTRAVVKGFGETYNTRVQNFGRAPGVYVNTSWVDVQAEGIKEPINLPSHFVSLEDKHMENARQKKYAAAGGWNSHRVWLRELPFTELWEQDVVKWVSNRECPFDGQLVVSHINYDWMVQKRNDGSPMPTINVGVPGGGYCAVNESDVKLVSRGNVWKYHHGERLEFKSIEEEAHFFDLIGQTDEVCNPSNGFFSWTAKEAIAAIKEEIADGIQVHNGIFDFSNRIVVLRFRDRKLGRRVANEVIKNFKNFKEIE